MDHQLAPTWIKTSWPLKLFPNDAPWTAQGTPLPDHGELWCRPWSFEIVKDSPEEVVVHLWYLDAVTSTKVEKWLTLRAGESILRFRHRMTNLGKDPLDFLWKLHPALSVSEHHRIDVPGKRGEYVAPGWSRLDDAEPVFDWPIARNGRGETADLRHILPASAGKRDFVYVSELSEGWCALTDTQRGVGFGLRFPREVFPYVWLFMPAGGWRDIHTVILEPCTAYPKDLAAAIRGGTCGHLAPGGVLECEVLTVAYQGLGAVMAVRPNGDVEGLR